MQWLCSSTGAPGRDEVRGELAHGVGRQQAAGILEVEAVDVRAVRERGDALGVVRVRVHGADRVRQPDDDLLDALLARHPRGAAERLRVVGRLGELEAADAVADDAPEREPHHVLVARLPGDEAHAGRDEVEERVRHRRAHQPDQLPRVLAVEAHGDRHVRARREVERMEADALQRRRDREDVVRREAGRAPEALVAVARRRVDDVDDAAHGSIRKSGAPYSTIAPFSDVDLGDRAGDARVHGVHHLHHLDDADDRLRLDAAADLDERRLARRGRAVEGADHRRLDRQPLGGPLDHRLLLGRRRGARTHDVERQPLGLDP